MNVSKLIMQGIIHQSLYYKLSALVPLTYAPLDVTLTIHTDYKCEG